MYFLRKPIHFDPAWVPVYVVINFSVAVAFVLLINPVLDFVARRRQHDDRGKQESAHLARGRALLEDVAHRPYLLLLVPGEDGLFLVPLLAYGLGPVSAAVAAVAFGAWHYNSPSTPRACVSKAIGCYISCLLVLPHGLLTMIAGHLCLDGAAVLAAKALWKDTATDNADKA